MLITHILRILFVLALASGTAGTVNALGAAGAASQPSPVAASTGAAVQWTESQQTVSQPFAVPGDVLTYTLTLTNSSGLTATGTLVTDTLGTNLAFVAASPGGAYSLGHVAWSLPDMLPGASTVLTLSAQVAAPVADGTLITNRAAVSSTGLPPFELPELPAVAYVYNPALADFTASAVSGLAPLSVTFANTSQHGVAYLWDFGDGITSTLAAPDHVYTAIGVYTVSLRAANPSSTAMLTRTNYIRAVDPALGTLYLPIITRPVFGITARVTDGGAPAPGLQVELRRFDGAAWSTAGAATTDAQGVFMFASPAPLGPGEKYYVRYTNPEDNTNRLAAWFSRELFTYAAGELVNIGDFDVAGINLVAPDSATAVTLPTLFTWQVRPATPGDSYEFNLFDPATGSPWFSTLPPLGYVGDYTLSGLPAGFSTYIWYGWSVGVYTSNTAYGLSDAYGMAYYYRHVSFVDGASGAASLQLPSLSVTLPLAQSGLPLERDTFRPPRQ